MNLATLNRQVVTFLAISLLFLGSLAYFIGTAVKDRDILEGRQTADDYLKTI